MKYLIWKEPRRCPPVPREITEIQGYTPLLGALLTLRGITDPAEARAFLHGGEEQLRSPLDIADMDKAAARLNRAIADGEYVAVFGDYDVDGITAACLVSDYLESRGLRCTAYVPNRIEGSGLNCAAILRLRERGVSLLVTVDCGITNVEEVAFARSIGMDVIVTDHHECRHSEEDPEEEELPAAVAVVDPKVHGGSVGQTLAGVGVAFKLVCALDGNTRAMVERFSDLVAVGMVADVMSMRSPENRYLVRQGLRRIEEGGCRPGFSALLEHTGGKKTTSSTISYTMAPRINAAGRMGDVALAVRLLKTGDMAEACELAGKLEEKNRNRQTFEREISAAAEKKLQDETLRRPIILCEEDWHQGVMGIVASRLADHYSVPAIMITMGKKSPDEPCRPDDVGKGSCRSVGSFNLYDALYRCRDCLETFGGHAMAVGITIRRDRIEELRRRLGELYAEYTAPVFPSLLPELQVDSAELLTQECVESLDLLEPCGNSNLRPLMYMDDAVLRELTATGGGRHLRLRVEKFGESYDCVFFSQVEKSLGVSRGDRIDLVFTPQINEYRSSRTVQLVISDIRPHQN